MASALADDLPALLAKRLDEALAGDDRLPRTHAGSGIVRRITPLSRGFQFYARTIGASTEGFPKVEVNR